MKRDGQLVCPFSEPSDHYGAGFPASSCAPNGFTAWRSRNLVMGVECSAIARSAGEVSPEPRAEGVSSVSPRSPSPPDPAAARRLHYEAPEETMSTIPLTLVEGAIAMPRLRPLRLVPTSFGRDWALRPPARNWRAEIKALYAAVLHTFCLTDQVLQMGAVGGGWGRSGGTGVRARCRSGSKGRAARDQNASGHRRRGSLHDDRGPCVSRSRRASHSLERAGRRCVRDGRRSCARVGGIELFGTSPSGQQPEAGRRGGQP
jgi:hypothetical protein